MDKKTKIMIGNSSLIVLSVAWLALVGSVLAEDRGSSRKPASVLTHPQQETKLVPDQPKWYSDPYALAPSTKKEPWSLRVDGSFNFYSDPMSRYQAGHSNYKMDVMRHPLIFGW
jgi:hypothetical protein